MSGADSPLISIVLPVHNGSRFLQEAVAGIRAQTLSTWELIIVDDASTDNTPEMAAELSKQDYRILTIRHAVNRRLPAALNTGFKAACGCYLTWTSDDNWYKPNALSVMAGFLDARPDIDVAYADYTTVNEAGDQLGRISVGQPVELVARNCVGACFLFRREVFSSLGGYDEGRFLTEDYDFWLRAASRFRLAPIHEDLYCYRQHGQSLTQTRREEILRATDALLEERIPGMKNINRRARVAAVLQLVQRAYQRAECESAARLLRVAFRLSWWLALRDPQVAPFIARQYGYRTAKIASLVAGRGPQSSGGVR